METLFWKCPQCDTINSDIACEHCQFSPDYYILIDPADPLAQKSPSIYHEPQVTKVHGWICSHCRTVNELGAGICVFCGKQKQGGKSHLWWVVGGIALLGCLCLVGVTVILGSILFYRPPIQAIQSESIVTVAIQDENPVPSFTPILKTKQNNLYPNPPTEGCVLWSKIITTDEGKTLCVYGLVVDSYKGDVRRFYIRFGEDGNSFRIMLLNGLRPSLKPGQCVYQTGTIKVYGTLPYMELTEMVLFCPT